MKDLRKMLFNGIHRYFYISSAVVALFNSLRLKKTLVYAPAIGKRSRSSYLKSRASNRFDLWIFSYIEAPNDLQPS